MRLHDFLDYQAREYPDLEFAVQGQRRLTYAEALDRVNQIANAFIAAGLQKGDRVAVLSKNSIEYALLYFGASKAGVALVPLNYRLAGPEWAYIINDGRATMLLAAGEFTAAADALRGEVEAVTRWIAIDGTAGGGWERLDTFLNGCPTTPPDRVVSETDDVYQMYTSGTTGRPKGAVLTHASVTANMVQVSVAVGPSLKVAPGQRWLVVAPMYHAAAAMTTFVCMYWAGSLYIQADFVPTEVVRALSEERIALAMLVPAMVQACLVLAPDVAARRYPDLQLISYGGSPIAEQTLRRAIEVFGCDFVQGYGMTETSAALTYLLPDDHVRALAGQPELLLSAGRPLVGTDMRLVDEHNEDVRHGQVGEIIARGPQLMRGYWNLPDATAEAMRDGWMHTGDAGIRDADGYIYIQDRVKDMIVSGGENVYPREVEEVLFQHPAVADAAVIGVPDPQWGESVKAIVVLREGAQASAEEILAFTRGRLGGFKRPKSVDFVSTLPRNPSGKVLKRELRDPYWAGQGRRVG